MEGHLPYLHTEYAREKMIEEYRNEEKEKKEMSQKAKAHTRICRTCKKEKPLFDFTKNKSKILGYDYQCKDCHKIDSMQKRKAYPEKAREINRKSTINNSHKWKKMWAEYQKKYCAKYPDRHRANALLNYYISTGSIKKPKICSRCNNENNIEAHHHDYKKPLDVIWVCRVCHKNIHHNKISAERIAL